MNDRRLPSGSGFTNRMIALGILLSAPALAVVLLILGVALRLTSEQWTWFVISGIVCAAIATVASLRLGNTLVVPISRKEDERVAVMEKAHELAGLLKDEGVRVRVDERDHLSPGAKFWEWERKGVPFRLEIGPKDLAKEQAVLVRRVTFGDENRKEFLPEREAVATMTDRLGTYQASLLKAAKDRREANSYRDVEDLGGLKEIMDGPGGFVFTGWSGDPAVEEPLMALRTRVGLLRRQGRHRRIDRG